MTLSEYCDLPGLRPATGPHVHSSARRLLRGFFRGWYGLTIYNMFMLPQGLRFCPCENAGTHWTPRSGSAGNVTLPERRSAVGVATETPITRWRGRLRRRTEPARSPDRRGGQVRRPSTGVPARGLREDGRQRRFPDRLPLNPDGNAGENPAEVGFRRQSRCEPS